MNLQQFNFKPIIACFVLLHVLGFLWYGPLFQEPWLRLSGITLADVEANQGDMRIWITNTISAAASIMLLAWLFYQLDVVTWMRGAIIGLTIGFVFILMTRMTSDLFALKPYALSWINGGFNTVGLTLTGAILGAFPKRKSAVAV